MKKVLFSFIFHKSKTHFVALKSILDPTTMLSVLCGKGITITHNILCWELDSLNKCNATVH